MLVIIKILQFSLCIYSVEPFWVLRKSIFCMAYVSPVTNQDEKSQIVVQKAVKLEYVFSLE
jgi:hypothetical protein